MTGGFAQQPGVFMGFVHRRRRGAELFLLVLGAHRRRRRLRAVGLGADDEVPPTSSRTAAGWRRSIISPHRRPAVAPYADPVLLPVVVALNGIGLAMIHRIDIGRRGCRREQHDFAQQQLTWMSLAWSASSATLVVIRDHRGLQAFTYTVGLSRRAAAAAAGARARGQHQRRPHLDRVGAVQLPARRDRQDLLAIFFAGYSWSSATRSRWPGPAFMGIDLPARARPRADPADVAGQPRRAGLPARPRFVAAVLRPVRGAALRRHRAGGLAGRRRRCCSSAGAYFGYLCSATSRPASTAGSTRSATPTSTVPDHPGQCTAWPGAASSAAGLGEGSPQLTPYAWTDFIVASIGEELGLTGADGDHRDLRSHRRARLSAPRWSAGTRSASCSPSASAVVIALQVFVVIGGVTRLIPLTGLTTPFMSYGGSSLIANWIIVALLLRISRPGPAARPRPAPADDADDETQVVKLR